MLAWEIKAEEAKIDSFDLIAQVWDPADDLVEMFVKKTVFIYLFILWYDLSRGATHRTHMQHTSEMA